ncbi:MAG: DNA polymerase, partial [Bacteroidota bacterium]
MPEKKLFLLDGHALVYRAHYAFITRPLINSKGVNTSAITGMTRFIWDVIRNQNPTHIAVAFDLSGPTFRNDLYPEYKANREVQPEDITIALPYIREIIEGFKIPVVTKEGYEADDVIGTLAKQAEKEGFDVYMVTPDKDYAQLVSEKIFMYKPARMGNGVEILGVPEVLEKWQIKKVEQVIDILGLQGDAVDNIPGIPGIGAKTAVKLLAKFDSVEGLLANTDQLKGKQKEKVEQFAEQGRLSKTLATIDINVPIQFDAKRYEIEAFDRERLEKVFKELEFRSLAKSILGVTASTEVGQQGNLFGNPLAAGATTPAPKRFVNQPAAHSVADKNINNTEHDYQLVDTPELRKALIEKLKQSTSFCFDTETTSIDANDAELVGIAFSVKTGEAFYVPVPSNEDEAKAIVAEFKEILEDKSIEKVGQNLKYDCIVLKWYGVEVAGTFFDTMLAHYLIEPELRHNMDYLAESYLKYQPVSITTLIGKKGKHQLTMRQVPVEKVVEYAGEDADITLQLGDYFRPKLKEEKLEQLYSDMEEPLMKVLVDLEYNGINLDVAYLEKYSKELDVLIKEAQAEIYQDAGGPFNISSPKQVGEVLFDKMGLPYRWKKTKSGQYSTSEEKLTEMAADFEIVNKILKYRSYTKLKSTYVDA